MRENLELTHGALFSQRLLLALIEQGATRDEAYRVAQELAQRAWDERTPLRALVEADPRCARSTRGRVRREPLHPARRRHRGPPARLTARRGRGHARPHVLRLRDRRGRQRRLRPGQPPDGGPGTTVLLIEAGPPDTDDFIHIPAAFSALYRSRNDWDYTTGYEHGADGRRIYLPRGKTLGGSSSMNAMIYIRGNRRDWDEWAAEGCEGWGWDAILPYFKKAEDNVRGPSELHGAGGPVRVSDSLHRNVLSQAFLDAAGAAGIPETDDFNGPEQDGVGWYQLFTRDGKRGSTAVSYVHPVADRPNLTVETHVHVTACSSRAPGRSGWRASGSRSRSPSTPRRRSSCAPGPTTRRSS
jgi:hypothetical protein